jgi:hypothetical protein
VQSERNRDTVQPERNTEAMVEVEAELNDDSKEHPKATEPNVEEIGRERSLSIMMTMTYNPSVPVPQKTQRTQQQTVLQ